MRKITIFILSLLPYLGAEAQTDSTITPGIFQRISTELQSFRIDTSEAPDDRVTKLILQLRSAKGGFNIEEAIAFKMEEERREKKTPDSTLLFLEQQFNQGIGKKWLENAMIHIYRSHFSYKELKKLVKFYRSPAGKKLSAEFPLVMMKSLMAGQLIHDKLLEKKNP